MIVKHNEEGEAYFHVFHSATIACSLIGSLRFDTKWRFRLKLKRTVDGLECSDCFTKHENVRSMKKFLRKKCSWKKKMHQ